MDSEKRTGVAQRSGWCWQVKCHESHRLLLSQPWDQTERRPDTTNRIYVHGEREAWFWAIEGSCLKNGIGTWWRSCSYTILFCDDIQNVESKFWEQLVNISFLKDHKLRIVGATTRRCASDPASPLLNNDSLISFADLRLRPDEHDDFLTKLLSEKDGFGELDDASRNMVINAVRDQCGGHVFALQVSVDKLNEYARLPQNRNSQAMISYLLSKPFLDHTDTRTWPPNTDDFSDDQRKELEDAMMEETKRVSADVLSVLLKGYFIQDTNQKMEPMTWLEIKQHISFKLSARRLYSSLFRDRAADGSKFASISDLILQSL